MAAIQWGSCLASEYERGSFEDRRLTNKVVFEEVSQNELSNRWKTEAWRGAELGWWVIKSCIELEGESRA